MFLRNLKQLYCVCDRTLIRNLRSRRLDSLGPNPGLNKRIQAFKDEGYNIVDEDAEEFIEQSESDFMNVQEAYDSHVKGAVVDKKHLRHKIVKDKYFKEQYPNLLTWSEKEQIRHLNNTEPEEWSPERIAESFPVTPQTVKKLLKYPWKPATEERIARHDASAMRNWRQLKEGTLNIPNELKNHFLKFSERTIPPLNKKSIKIDITLENKLGEFESIIQKCAANENLNKDEISENETNDNNDGQKKNKKDWKRVTLDELTTSIKNRLEKGNDIITPDQIMLNTVNENHKNEVTTQENLENEIVSFDSIDDNKMTEFKQKEEKVITVTDYPERIRIPKKAYKRGATYKVNDCFYDHDGRFLYRVIGLTD